jgi:enoyl-[acyl-carrier protein] reductase II
MNPLTAILGCRLPLIQGAMGVISNPELVAAVSEAGGFGVLATAFQSDPKAVRGQIHAVHSLTDKPFGINLAAFNPASEKIVDIVLEEGLKVVTTSAGSPAKLAPKLKEAGVKVLHVTGTVEAAVRAEQTGVDAIIAEGAESGGVQGRNAVSTMVLVPLTVDAVNIPVVAAGGIGDNRSFRAALALGAVGVQVGTALIVSRECIAHMKAKNQMLASTETDTRVLCMGRICVRVVNTPLVDHRLAAETGMNLSDLAAGQNAAWLEGRLEEGVLAAGQSVGFSREIRAAGDIVRQIAGRNA